MGQPVQFVGFSQPHAWSSN